MLYTFMIIQINILVVDKKFPLDYPKCGAGSALSTSDHCIYSVSPSGSQKKSSFFTAYFFLTCLIFRQGLWSDTPNRRSATTREARTSAPDRTFSIKMEDFSKSQSEWIMTVALTKHFTLRARLLLRRVVTRRATTAYYSYLESTFADGL